MGQEVVMSHLFWLSDAAWARIEPLLPRGKPGKPRVDDRRVISGILHVLKTGCRWRDVPAAYGPPTTIYNRFYRWMRRGLWLKMFEQSTASGDAPAELMLDSTYVKAHRSKPAMRPFPKFGRAASLPGSCRSGSAHRTGADIR